MDKAVKQYLNSLRCPICFGQIDMIEKRLIDGNNFGCVNDNYHYNLFYQYWKQPFGLIQEIVRIYDKDHLYEVMQSSDGNLFTEILVKNVDKEYRVIDKKKILQFRYDKKLFDFSQSNKDSILKRIKTVLIFQ